METEHVSITTSTSENMSSNEDNCLESRHTENTSNFMITATIIPLDESQEMLQEILPTTIFKHSYQIVKSQKVDRRVYPTKRNKKFTDDVLKVIGFLDSNTIKEIGQPPHFDINALLYTSAKEHLNRLKKIPEKHFKNVPPGWLNSTESKISALRKKDWPVTCTK